MKRTIGTFLVTLILVSFMHGAAVGQDTKTAEQLGQENLQAFREWREGMPDYEKRLYDRIKRINNRTVTIQSVTIIGIALLFVVSLATLFFVARRTGGFPRSISARDEKPQKSGMTLAGIIESERKFQRSLAERADRIRLKNLLRRQTELSNAVAELESFIASTNGSNEELDKLMTSIKEWVLKIQKEVDATNATARPID